MARKRKSSASDESQSRQLTAEDLRRAVSKIERRIEDLENFQVDTITERYDAKIQALEDKIDQTIADIFGHDTVEYDKYHIHSLDTLPSIVGQEYPLHEIHSGYQKGFEDAIVKLRSLRETLQEKLEDIPEESLCGSEPEKDLAPFDATAIIENLCNRFHLVVRQLESRHDKRDTLVVKDEYDVQDLLHSLLTLHFDDIRPEQWTPSYAGSSSRMDFVLKQEEIVIEVKKTRKTLGAKEVGEQLIIDIKKYEAHPDCGSLFCFVYDPEAWIANPRGIENDLNRDDGGLPVRVLITPV